MRGGEAPMTKYVLIHAGRAAAKDNSNPYPHEAFLVCVDRDTIESIRLKEPAVNTTLNSTADDVKGITWVCFLEEMDGGWRRMAGLSDVDHNGIRHDSRLPPTPLVAKAEAMEKKCRFVYRIVKSLS
ncbi:unnamed protein product [Strongylus vulgaris]|uniref:Uncharacterized protein n=1 Tax=Strongylus vulgaris TaxID=40348 RepID=A0A3P7KN60_STRVU|nr:unnamed protein product [Strongylus vulgaris]